MDANFYSIPNKDSEKVDLYISQDWDVYSYIVFESNYYADPSQNMWYEFYWKSVNYEYEDGTPVTY